MKIEDKPEIEEDRNGLEYFIVKSPAGIETCVYLKDAVYQSFIGQIPYNKEVYFIDGDVKNTSIKNLGLKEKLDYR